MTNHDLHYEFDERAGIYEYDGAMSRADAEKQAMRDLRLTFADAFEYDPFLQMHKMLVQVDSDTKIWLPVSREFVQANTTKEEFEHLTKKHS